MDDAELDSLKQELQSFFSDGLVTLVGSGLSVAEGMPGMAQLAEHLVAEVSIEDFDGPSHEAWRCVSQALHEGSDLETALQNCPPTDPLESQIVSITSSFISQHERSVLSALFSGAPPLRFSRLIRHFLRGNRPLPIITTNYDRLLEVACELSDVSVDTLFVGTICATFQPNTSHWTSCRGAYLRASPRRHASFKWADRAVILKPHGSLDWYLVDGDPIRLTAEIDAQPLMITPGLNKYRTGYDRPFDIHRERANRYIDNASCFLALGYGFRDEHLQTHVTPAIKKGKPMLIITRTLSEAAVRMIQSSDAVIGLSAPSGNPGSGTVITRRNETRFLPSSRLWDIDHFVSEVLEP